MRRATGVALIVMLGVGIGVGYLLWGGQASSARRVADRTTFEMDQARPGRAAAPDLRAALASIALPPVETGTGSITGTVTSKNGTPMEGVVVRAMPNIPRKRLSEPKIGIGLPPDRELEEIVRERVVRILGARRRRVFAGTGPDGRYELTELADREYTVRPFHNGFVFLPARGSKASHARPGATVDFVADPVVEVRVTPLLPDGSEPETATLIIRVEMGQWPWNLVWSRGDPTVNLRPGRHEFMARVGDHYRSPRVEAVVTAEGPPPDVKLTLESCTAISGHVRMPDGEETHSIKVYVLQVPSRRKPKADLLLSAGRKIGVASHDAYHFYLGDAKPGTYAVGAGWHADRIDIVELAEVSQGTTKVDLCLPPVDPKEYVLVRVLGPEGRPVKCASISTTCSQTSFSRSGSYWIRRTDGSYWVAHADWVERSGERDENTRYAVRISVNEYGERQVTYRPGEDAEVTVRLDSPTSLEIVLGGYADSELQGLLRLRVIQDSKTKAYTSPRSPDWKGRAVFPLQPGPYEILLYSKISERAWAVASRMLVTVSAGENHVALPLPRLHTLTVIVPERATLLYLRPSDRTPDYFTVHRVVGKDRKVVVDRLPAGEYFVFCYGGRKASATVKVPTQTMVRLE